MATGQEQGSQAHMPKRAKHVMGTSERGLGENSGFPTSSGLSTLGLPTESTGTGVNGGTMPFPKAEAPFSSRHVRLCVCVCVCVCVSE